MAGLPRARNHARRLTAPAIGRTVATMGGTTDLNRAFALRSADDCRALYDAWAASYDAGFAEGMDYRLPAHVAAAFLAAGGTGPVLDVGAGTGLLAAALRAQGLDGDIDGIDLSPAMLAAAGAKRLYRALVAADVTRPLTLAGRYRGIVSSGTFTQGHVGPEALPHLVAVAEPGAQVALSINARVFAAQGFDRALERLEGIAGRRLIEVPIYGAAAAARDPAHAADRALIALFRRV
jgi:SAM-dependent methyltransferase